MLPHARPAATAGLVLWVIGRLFLASRHRLRYAIPRTYRRSHHSTRQGCNVMRKIFRYCAQQQGVFATQIAFQCPAYARHRKATTPIFLRRSQASQEDKEHKRQEARAAVRLALLHSSAFSPPPRDESRVRMVTTDESMPDQTRGERNRAFDYFTTPKEKNQYENRNKNIGRRDRPHPT